MSPHSPNAFDVTRSCSCYQASLAVAWMYIHGTARLACTNIPKRYTVYEMMRLMMDW